jgi:hypothetical protein
LDARCSGCHRNLDYLHIHRTLTFLLTNFPLKERAFIQGDSFMKNGKKRRAWTSVQVRELKTLARKKTPAKKIAKSLKRTEGATRQKAFSNGLSLDSRP